MKTIISIFLFTISTCIGQTANETISQNRIVHQWTLKQFEKAEKNGVIVTVTLTQFADNVYFIFRNDHTLEVLYSDKKKEYYVWNYNRNFIEIIASDTNFNSEILGKFELHFLDKVSQLFLQRKNDPHHGIMLKV